jgi:hypothetical protein
MKINAGQNIVQPKGGAGGGIIGAIFGGLANANQTKQRFALQQAIMDHAHENKLKEIAFKNIVGAKMTGAAVESGTNALIDSYNKIHGDTPDENGLTPGMQVLREHHRQGGSTEKGGIGPRSDIATAEINIEKNKSKPITQPVNGWNPEESDITTALKENNKLTNIFATNDKGETEESTGWTPTKFEPTGEATFTYGDAQALANIRHENPSDNRTDNLNTGMGEGK